MIEIIDLLLDGLTRLEQRCDDSDQFGAVLNQFCCARSKAVELGTTNYPTKILEQTDLGSGSLDRA